MIQRSPTDIRSRLDFWQAITGACLALFVCIHLLFEGTVILDQSVTDGIGWLLEATYLAQIAAPCILLVIFIHFYIAARKMPFRKGELSIFISHSEQLRDGDTWLWLVQVFTALIILGGAFFHVYTVMADMPIEVAKSSARLHSGWIFFHLIFLPAVILHTGIGIWRIGVKYGFICKATKAVWSKRIWIGMLCYFILGLGALARVWCL